MNPTNGLGAFELSDKEWDELNIELRDEEIFYLYHCFNCWAELNPVEEDLCVDCKASGAELW